MVSNFVSVDSQLSSLSSSIAGLGSLASKSAVASADITDGTVATADVADSAVTSAKISDGTIATADIANSAVTDAKVAAGIAPSKLAQASATSGQVLKWNGSAWAPAADSTGTAGGITAITTASCLTSGGEWETSCTANCPAGYFRTGCAPANGRLSGITANGCTFASYSYVTHYTLCAK